MPEPIEPNPMTAMVGFAVSGMRRFLRVPLGRWVRPWALRYHDLAALPKHETRPKRDITMSETKVRDEICRLGRSLFERGLTPGSSGNISVRLDDGGSIVTPTNASLGFLDPAKLSRLHAPGQLVSRDAPH